MRMILQLAVVAALGLAVSGCDKCGDYFWQKTGSKVCSAEPKPN